MTGILNILSAVKTGIASAIDAYFNLTTLLLPGDGTNGAQNNTFLDSSSNAFTITRNGNTTQGTFSPFSQTGWSVYFDGNASCDLAVASTAQFNWGTSDFCIEAFVNPQVVASARIINFGDGIFNFEINASGFLSYFQGSSFTASTGALAANTWSHCVITRQSGTVRMFANGVLVYTNTNTTSKGTSTANIGSYPAGGDTLTGHLSNLRVINGNVPAAYQTSSTTVGASIFSVPTAPLTAVSGTALLTCQANRFVDNSGNNLSVTVGAGTPSVQAFSPFAPTAAYSAATNGGSGYFDGSGDTLTWTDASNVLDLGGSQASAEWWFYPQSSSATQVIMYKGGGATNWSMTNGFEWHIQFVSQKFTFAYSDGGGGVASIADTTARGINQWYHVAVATNASNAISLFVNGVRVATATGAIGKPASRTSIGFGSDLSGNFYLGFSSGVRIIKGAGAYDPTQTSITVPTAPPTAITNTSLLLNFTNAGITDATAKNVLETVGSAQISTTQSKWGGSSIAVTGGTANYIVAPNVTNYTLYGAFTIEGWVYRNSSTARAIFVEGRSAGGYANYLFAILGNGTAEFVTSNSANYYNPTETVASGQWVHVALVRDTSNVVKLYINGVGASTTKTISGVLTPAASAVWLGGQRDPQYSDAYIDDFRISQLARYTGNFTPPTAAFALQ